MDFHFLLLFALFFNVSREPAEDIRRDQIPKVDMSYFNGFERSGLLVSMPDNACLKGWFRTKPP